MKVTHRISSTREPCTRIRIAFTVTSSELEQGVMDAAHDLARESGQTSSYDPYWIANACARVTKGDAEVATRKMLWQHGADGSGYRYEDIGQDAWDAARDRAMELWPEFYPEGVERPNRRTRPTCPFCGGVPYPGMAEGNGQIAWTCRSCGDEWYTEEDDDE